MNRWCRPPSTSSESSRTTVPAPSTSTPDVWSRNAPSEGRVARAERRRRRSRRARGAAGRRGRENEGRGGADEERPRDASRHGRLARTRALPGHLSRRASVSPGRAPCAMVPVRTTSSTPSGCSSSRSASSLSLVPTTRSVSCAPVDVDDLGVEDLGDLQRLGALLALAGDAHQQQLGRHLVAGVEVADLEHVDELVQLLGDLVHRVLVAVDDDGDARELGSSLRPTARLSMLKPRRAKSPATRVSTPGLFSTRMESVCFTASSSLCATGRRSSR